MSDQRDIFGEILRLKQEFEEFYPEDRAAILYTSHDDYCDLMRKAMEWQAGINLSGSTVYVFGMTVEPLRGLKGFIVRAEGDPL